MNILDFIKPNKNTVYTPLNSIGVKITDNWNCWWYHNERTGNRNQKLIQNVYFFDETFFSDFLEITSELNICKIHLAGDEPSLHSRIDSIIRKLKEYTFIVKMTSIGGNKRIFEKIITSGIDDINFTLDAIDKNEIYKTRFYHSDRMIHIQIIDQGAIHV